MIAVDHLAVVGVGLIGGSFAKALRAAGKVGRITGIGRSEANLLEAKRLGIIDHYAMDLVAVAGADLIMVAVPMGAYGQVFSALELHARADAIITDAGSTKQHAIRMAEQFLTAPGRFVPAHPIAGAEHSGAAAASVDLFVDRLVVITPTPKSESQLVGRVTDLWQTIGANVVEMDAKQHDQFLAAVSHLPHLAAFALVNAVAAQGDGAHDPFGFAAGGFRDFTRIASSSPVMWRDIALTNREALLASIDAMAGQLAQLRGAIAQGDGALLLEHFTKAKAARDGWLARSEGGMIGG
ncbi:MAG: prephenate dehydrogenase/arogenate dehydrogenase family protein [Mariprofundales bacterium]|nr:prephenate dehydrogenase/arogenate dehydrogenase family protein [Mariprofundales bacterium]